MSMIDTAGNIITLGVAGRITTDLLNPRKPRRKKKKKRR
jgi:hypothetical protein